ncbi:TPA: mechanosensitive ion channel family protein, partial [Mannheimia haemolytica]|nr:mechanosensitive ion channel family protein [Mannheimia haemolytica]
MTEKVTETAPNIDVVAETEKVIHKVSNMNI